MTAKALEGRKRLSYMKSCLYFSGSHRGVSVHQSPDLDRRRNVDLLWCVRIALSAVVLGINVTEIGNTVEQCQAMQHGVDCVLQQREQDWKEQSCEG